MSNLYIDDISGDDLATAEGSKLSPFKSLSYLADRHVDIEDELNIHILTAGNFELDNEILSSLKDTVTKKLNIIGCGNDCVIELKGNNKDFNDISFSEGFLLKFSKCVLDNTKIASNVYSEIRFGTNGISTPQIWYKKEYNTLYLKCDIEFENVFFNTPKLPTYTLTTNTQSSNPNVIVGLYPDDYAMFASVYGNITILNCSTPYMEGRKVITNRHNLIKGEENTATNRKYYLTFPNYTIDQATDINNIFEYSANYTVTIESSFGFNRNNDLNWFGHNNVYSNAYNLDLVTKVINKDGEVINTFGVHSGDLYNWRNKRQILTLGFYEKFFRGIKNYIETNHTNFIHSLEEFFNNDYKITNVNNRNEKEFSVENTIYELLVEELKISDTTTYNDLASILSNTTYFTTIVDNYVNYLWLFNRSDVTAQYLFTTQAIRDKVATNTDLVSLINLDPLLKEAYEKEL